MEKLVILIFIPMGGITIHIGVWPVVILVDGSEYRQISTPLTLLIKHYLHLTPYLTFDQQVNTKSLLNGQRVLDVTRTTIM